MLADWSAQAPPAPLQPQRQEARLDWWPAERCIDRAPTAKPVGAALAAAAYRDHSAAAARPRRLAAIGHAAATAERKREGPATRAGAAAGAADASNVLERCRAAAPARRRL